MTLHDKLTATVAIIGVLGFLYALACKRSVAGDWQLYLSYGWIGNQVAILSAAIVCVDGLFRLWS